MTANIKRDRNRKMRTKIKIAASALALAMLASLSSCSFSSYPTPISYKTEVIELNDTRKVTCVLAISDYKVSGMSCDWAHASGADLDPSRQ